MKGLTAHIVSIFLLAQTYTGLSQKPDMVHVEFYPVNSTQPLEPYYRDKADSILTADAPRHKPFKSDYGEMLYYIEGFRDEARRNGNVNWDKGYKRSAQWIKWVLLKETKTFPDEIKKEIEQDLKRIRKFRRPYTDHDVYDRLVRRVIEYFEAGAGWQYQV